MRLMSTRLFDRLQVFMDERGALELACHSSMQANNLPPVPQEGS